jgi:hypothetical protein
VGNTERVNDAQDNAMLALGGFPLCASPSGEVLKWPRIKRVQRTANSTHYVAADGTDVQVDSDGSKIVRWHIGQCKEADAHYGSTVWCMKVTACALCSNTHSSTGGS